MANDKNFKVKNGLDVGDKTTITSSGTIGLGTAANGYLQITDGTTTLAFDPNEIYGTGDLNIGTAAGDIDLRPFTGAIKVYDGTNEATLSYTKIGQWDSAYSSLSNYLPLSGGTLTGNLGLETALNPKLRLKTTDTTITTGQVISTVEFIGAIGVGSTTAGHIQQVATEDWAAGAVGSDMVFSINTGSSFDEKLRLNSDGLEVTGTITATDYNDTNWDTAYTYSQVGHLPLAGGTLTGALIGTDITSSGYLQATSFLYTRNNLRVLNAAGTGWTTWGTRTAGNYNLSIGTLTASGALTGTTADFSSSVEANNFNVVGGAFIARNPGNVDGSLWLASSASGTTSANGVTLAGGTSAYSYHNSSGINIKQGGLLIDDTEVIDSSRNLTNIGTISSGAITATGLDVTGTATMDGLDISSTGNDSFTQTHTDGNTVIFTQSGTGGDVQWRNANGGALINTAATNRALFASNGDISFYEDTGTTEKLVWSAANEDLNFADSVKATFGAGDDLQIYHDGSNSRIVDTGTGDLSLEGANIRLRSTNGDVYAYFSSNEEAELYYNGSPKLATTATGIDVTGTATMDGLTVVGATTLSGLDVDSTTPQIKLNETDVTDENTQIIQASGSVRVRTVTDAGALVAERLRIDHGTGDVSFFEDTGTTAKFIWDASAESLSVGTFFSVSSVGSVNLTNVLAGSGSAGSPAYTFGSDQNTGLYRPTTDTLAVTTAGSEKMRIDSSGNVGIGSTSASGSRLRLDNGGTSGAPQLMLTATGASTQTEIRHDTSGNLIFDYWNGGGTRSERMRIDSSGNVLVGTTDTAPATNNVKGIALRSEGHINVSRASGVVGYFNRKTDDGTILDFRKDGVPVGSIGSRAGLVTNIILDPRANGSGLTGTTDTIAPIDETGTRVDGQINLSSSAYKFKDLHLSGTAFVGTSVGIGTSSPDAPLHISKAATGINAATTVLKLSSVDTNTAQYVGFQTQRDNSAGQGLNILVTNVVGTVSEAMRILPTGNVGIGTSSPSRTLSVYSTSSIPCQIESSGSDARISIFTSSGSGGQGFVQASSGSLLLGSSNTERMRITSSGNVGIGTSNPERKVHIFNGASTALASNANSALVIEDDSNAYISFLSPNFLEAGLLFGDSADNDVGSLTYNHLLDRMSIRVGGSSGLSIESTGIDVTGTVTATDGNSTEWNTAYGWGDHAGNYLPLSGGTLTGALTTTEITAGKFVAKQLTGVIGNSYDERVVLLCPKVETNNSYINIVNGKLTALKSGGNVCDSFDVFVHSVYNDTRASFVSSGQRTNHKFVTCTYGGIKWVAIKFGYTANPYNYFQFEGVAETNFPSNGGNQLKVIAYYDTQSGGTVLNAEINNSIADYNPDNTYTVFENGSTTFNSPVIGLSSITSSGVITATGGNSTNWNTAYGWGNHASAGYAPIASPSFTGTLSLGSFFSVSNTATVNLTNVLAGSGSAASPAYGFGSDQNTGIYRPTTDTLAVTTAGSEKMRIDSSGNVGIGTSSPSAKLDSQETYDTVTNILTNGTYAAKFGGDTAVGAAGRAQGIMISGRDGTARGVAILAENQNSGNAHDLLFATSSNASVPTERMRIDSSGNVLVGTTSAQGAGGVTLSGAGYVYSSRPSSTAIYADRTGSDGAIQEFRKNGTTVGSIGTVGGLLGVGSGVSNLQFESSSTAISPASTTSGGASDGALDLGKTNRRFKDLYLSGNVTASTINSGTPWTTANDGSGSGLDADTVDGHHAYESQILDTRDSGDVTPDGFGDKKVSYSFTDEIAGSTHVWDSVITVKGWSDNYRAWQITSNSSLDDTDQNLYFRSGRGATWGSLRTVWDSGNDGSGSGLDADLLDGVQGSSFLRSDQDDTMTGDLLMDSANAEINMKAGAAGTSGAVNWTFNTTGTNYASIKLPYDTRASTGLHIDSGYPITLDATTSIRFDISGAEKMRLFSNGNLSIGTTSSLGKLTVSNNGAEGIEFFPANITGGNTTQHYNRSGSAYLINNVIASEHRFLNSGAEKMRINSAGHLLHSTTSTTPTTGGTSILGGNASLLTQSHATGTSPFGFFQQYKYNSSVIGSVARNGNTGVYFVTSSDERLKENIADSDDAGSKIDAIQVRKYDWKVDGSHQDYGMIAQELVEVAPEAVSTPEDSEEMMGIDYSKLVPMLIKEIQSLRNRVAQLEE